MVVFAEKLNYHNLNTDLMKYLARLQGGDDQPSIRTNTTICLGKIGCFIDPCHRQRILISAFSRALKDPFPPARMAGVLALCATQQYYSLLEISTKILPALCVRDHAFKTIKGFLENLEKASENPDLIPEIEAQVKAGGKSSLLSSEKVPQWAGWALKTISGKFYKSTQPVVANSSSLNNPTYNSINSQNEDQKDSDERTKTITVKNSQEQPVSKDILDGWGDLDEDIESENEDLFLEANSEKISNFETSPKIEDYINRNLDQLAGEWEIDEKKSNGFNEVKKFNEFDEADWSTDWEKPSPAIKSTTPQRPATSSLASKVKPNTSVSNNDKSPQTNQRKGPLKLGSKKVTKKVEEPNFDLF